MGGGKEWRSGGGEDGRRGGDQKEETIEKGGKEELKVEGGSYSPNQN